MTSQTGQFHTLSAPYIKAASNEALPSSLLSLGALFEDKLGLSSQDRPQLLKAEITLGLKPVIKLIGLTQNEEAGWDEQASLTLRKVGNWSSPQQNAQELCEALLSVASKAATVAKSSDKNESPFAKTDELLTNGSQKIFQNISELKRRLTESQKQVQKLESQEKQLQASFEQMSQSAALREKNHAKIFEDYTKLQSTAACLEQENTSLKTDLDRLKQENEILKTDSKRHTYDLALNNDLMRQIEVLKSEKEALQLRIHDLTKLLKEARKAEYDFQQKIQTLETSQNSQQVQSLNQRVADLKNALTAANQRYQTLQEKFNKEHHYYDQSQKLRKEAALDQEYVFERIEHYSKKTAQAILEKNALEAEYTEYRNTANSLEEEYEKTIYQLKSQLEQTEKTKLNNQRKTVEVSMTKIPRPSSVASNSKKTVKEGIFVVQKAKLNDQQKAVGASASKIPRPSSVASRLKKTDLK